MVRSGSGLGFWKDCGRVAGALLLGIPFGLVCYFRDPMERFFHGRNPRQAKVGKWCLHVYGCIYPLCRMLIMQFFQASVTPNDQFVLCHLFTTGLERYKTNGPLWRWSLEGQLVTGLNKQKPSPNPASPNHPDWSLKIKPHKCRTSLFEGNQGEGGFRTI